MILISHRGAAGIEPENTLPSIEAAARLKVDMIEFDIRVTKDKHLIIFHDPNLKRIAGTYKNINSMTLGEVNTTITKSGHPIPVLAEALEAAGKVPLLLDCKGKDWAILLHEALKLYRGPPPTITSGEMSEMVLFSKLRPDLPTYVSELTRPFEALYKAKLFNCTGISMNFWILNPLVYMYARRNKLEFMIFTINNLFLARFLHFLYPSAAIITNVPDKLMPLRMHCKH